MSSIKGVMLLPLAAESYRRNVAHHTFLAKVNAPTKVPDPRLELTNFVEDWVRQELRSHFIETSYRVLRWEQLDARNHYVVRFRELDGVFDVGRGVKLLLEVKASASKSSLKSGLQQLRSAAARPLAREKYKHPAPKAAQRPWRASQEGSGNQRSQTECLEFASNWQK